MHPQLQKQLRRFRRQKRGYYSLWILGVLFVLSLGSEFLCNNRPIVLKYEGSLYFPVVKFYPSTVFGEEDFTEAEYKKLQLAPQFQKSGNWMIFPILPYGPNEAMENLPGPPPTRPGKRHFLGTDDRGRDLLTRLVYGFRNSMLFALISWVLIVVAAFVTGALQGFLGGRVDFYGQRSIEIWSALPVLYITIFLLSLYPPSLSLLTLIWVAFNWMGLSSYIRAEVLRIRKMDYVVAARALGGSTMRILKKHILPNSATPIITFSPFIISSGIGGLAALDYLGLGLPPPAASWGELLHQGKQNLSSWWLSFFPFFFLFLTLLLLNFVGEAVRSAFDARE